LSFKLKKLAIFASGEGTNAQCIIDYFNPRSSARVALIVCNNSNAGIIARAKKTGIPLLLITKKELEDKVQFLDTLASYKIDFIALAGFLWLIPSWLTNAFPDKIVNIHPALLPNYGGKGMYGANVHKAVISDKAKESGISIHLVNEKFDEGKIIFQAACKITPGETPESLAEKIHKLEHRHYPVEIEKLLT